MNRLKNIGRKPALLAITLLLLLAAACTNATGNDEDGQQLDTQNDPEPSNDPSNDPSDQALVGPAPVGGLPTVGEIGTPPCVPDAPVSVDMDQVSDLGFAPADAAAHAVGTHETTVVWASGESVPAEIVVSLLSEEARVFHFEPANTGEGTVPEIACLSHMELAVEIAVNSEDSRLGSTWGATMTASSADSASVSAELDPTAFDAILAELGAEGFDQVSVRLDLGFSPDGLEGEISGLGTSGGSPENGSETPVSVQRFNIASF